MTTIETYRALLKQTYYDNKRLSLFFVSSLFLFCLIFFQIKCYLNSNIVIVIIIS